MDRICLPRRWGTSIVLVLLFWGLTVETAPSESRVPSLLRPVAQLLPGWRFGGDLDLSLSMPVVGWKAGEKGSIQLVFRNFHFADPQESMLGDGLAGVIRLAGRPLTGGEVEFHAEIELTSGEVLVNRYYMAVGPDPLRMKLVGTWHPRQRSARGLQGTLEWGETIRASWEGSLGGLGRRLRGQVRADVEIPSMERLFGLLVAQPLGDTQAGLQDIKVRGRSRLQLRIEARAEASRLSGRLHLQGIDIDVPAQGVSIQGLAGEIPFDLPIDAEIGSRLGGRPAFGEIRLREVTVGKQHGADIHLPLRADWNRLQLNKALNIPIYQGRIRVEALEISRILPFPPTIGLGLWIEEVDLAGLSRALTPFEIPGKLQGEFPQIVMEGGNLRSRGRLAVHLWGGEVTMSNFWGGMILSKRRRLGCDILFRDLSMERATENLPFGRMGGVLEGEVKGLAFSFGQPESFELWARSVPTRGVKQYVDAKAVENLSILSSGMSAPLLPWFKYYPYSRMGIYCKLRNDVFTLRGTIIEDGTEYLVRRSFLRGINVINRNPNNRIPWRDMVRRISRILAQKGDKIRVQMGSSSR